MKRNESNVLVGNTKDPHNIVASNNANLRASSQEKNQPTSDSKAQSKTRDFVLDCTKATKPKLPQYNGLFDKHLVGFFERAQHRKNLYLNGMIDKEGKIVIPAKSNLNRFQKSSDRLAQAFNYQSHQNIKVDSFQERPATSYKQQNASELNKKSLAQPSTSRKESRKPAQLVYFSSNSIMPSDYLTNKHSKNRGMLPHLKQSTSNKSILKNSESSAGALSNIQVIESTNSSDHPNPLFRNSAVKSKSPIRFEDDKDSKQDNSNRKRYLGSALKEESNQSLNKSNHDRMILASGSAKKSKTKDPQSQQDYDSVYFSKNNDRIIKMLERRENKVQNFQIKKVQGSKRNINSKRESFNPNHLKIIESQNQNLDNQENQSSNIKQTSPKINRTKSAQDLKPMTKEDFKNFLDMFKSKIAGTSSVVNPSEDSSHINITIEQNRKIRFKE
ncbi:UNKNOWN [Stylonychia lemnae]|uniref:Uncharacterized protein n=1 Tax=Stylonychia lemnae TaxID=5949 RepID=A0A078A0C3_STYLE|nr:UNKNOWN [Stylonychia lemnae]|eukprot:CDW74888.1 UNKNOWN [Stylonychia lemnae]